MLAGVPSSVAPSSMRSTRSGGSRAPGGLVCPRCDAPAELGATLCGFCGVTLGEPPRRSGMTQRAMALDAEAARITLESRIPAAPSPPTRASAVVRSFWDGLFVVLTLGLGWIWLRRRAA